MMNNMAMTDADDDPFEQWYAPKIEQSSLRALMRRTNQHALVYLGTWLALCAATGYLVVLTRYSLWILPAMALYGSVLSFAYAVSHECAHGTAFRTRGLNETVFWITSLVFIAEPVYRRYSHAVHHTHTWFNKIDVQKPYGLPLSLWCYLTYTFGLTFYWEEATQLARHSTARFTAAELDFLPTTEIPKVIFNSRIMAACYASLLIGSIVFRSPWPFYLYFIPRFFGGGIVMAYINTQHMCMAEDVPDHRQTTRSIRCNRLERLLYWNMNYHIEHHLFPGMPFHALPALNLRIRDQLPPADAGVIDTNLAILQAIRRQRQQPDFNLAPAKQMG